MKRARNLYPKLISDENLRKAVVTVCNSHRWHHYPDKPNRKVIWMQETIEERVEELRTIIEAGFEPSPVRKKRRYDNNAGKWREIAEPALFPDQCIHHAMIQVLEPVMMRGMDHWCCGSIKGRGAHYGIRAIKKWIREGKGTKWCIELDIRHFYDSLRPERVLERMKQLIKDHRMLDLIWSVIKGGILIGAYCSQWFANTFLQPLDQMVRESGAIHYVRYMDNFTIFTNRRRTADRIIRTVEDWLQRHDLELKKNWQKFPLRARMPNALGYRFGRGFVLLRKKNRKRLIRYLKRFREMREKGRYITARFAQGLLSRLGLLRHCNSYRFYQKYVCRHTQRKLKTIIRNYQKEAMRKWNTSLETYAETV